MTARPPIRVTIDRLVLHGLAHADAAAVQRALAAELEARLAGSDPGFPAADSLRLSIAPAANPGELGSSAGAALSSALARPSPPSGEGG